MRTNFAAILAGYLAGLPSLLLPAVALVGCSSASDASPDSGTEESPDAGPSCKADSPAFDGPFDLPDGSPTTVALTGCGGPGYAAKFLVGTQTFDLTIDTGSGTLAVASSACTTCGVTPLYTPGPTAVDDNQPASDMYVQGSWQAEVYTDSVQLVGGPSAVSMNLAAIDSQSAFFTNAGCALGTVPFPQQGIVGFGPADLAQPGTDAFVTKLMGASGAPAVFAIEACAQGGQLMLGGVDPKAAVLTGAAVYTPLTMSQYYTVSLDAMRFGGTSLGFGAADFGPVVVDTGTSVISLPSPVFQALVSAIEGTPAFSTAFAMKGWLGGTMCFASNLSQADMDCQFPALTLSFPAAGGGMSVVTMKATESYLPAIASKGTTYYCSGIYENPPELATETILGTPVMQGQMVIFDLAGNRIGFAPQGYCR